MKIVKSYSDPYLADQDLFALHQLEMAASSFERDLGTPLAGPVSLIEKDGSLFFGVDKEKQKEVDFSELMTKVKQSMGLSPDSSILQVVGDSTLFSPIGTQKGLQFLQEELFKGDYLVLRGYTGHGDSAKGLADVNELVNHWMEQDPSHAKRVLANVVIPHTLQAIEWGCTTSSCCKNFFIVHNSACFGDDIAASDGLTQKALCLEGGVQSFAQVVNFLSNGTSIKGIHGLRHNHHLTTGAPLERPFFSAMEFLHGIQDIWVNTHDERAIFNYTSDYLATRDLFDPLRPEAATKPALFELAWNTFWDQRLFERLDLLDVAGV